MMGGTLFRINHSYRRSVLITEKGGKEKICNVASGEEKRKFQSLHISMEEFGPRHVANSEERRGFSVAPCKKVKSTRRQEYRICLIA